MLQLPPSHNRPEGSAEGSRAFWRLPPLMKPGWPAGPLGFLVAKPSTCHSAGELDWEGLHACYQVPAGRATDSPGAKPLLMRSEPTPLLPPQDWCWCKIQQGQFYWVTWTQSRLNPRIKALSWVTVMISGARHCRWVYLFFMLWAEQAKFYPILLHPRGCRHLYSLHLQNSAPPDEWIALQVRGK